jgi:hypothetical protein
VFYAPVDGPVNRNAQVFIVGLTPGLAQMAIAARTYLTYRERYANRPGLLRRAIRAHAAFAGSMRTNLCTMLDAIGLPPFLGIASSSALFEKHLDMIDTTSTLLYPVFKGPALTNFSGVADLARVPLFRTMIERLLVPRLRAASDAVIIPLARRAVYAML